MDAVKLKQRLPTPPSPVWLETSGMDWPEAGPSGNGVAWRAAASPAHCRSPEPEAPSASGQQATADAADTCPHQPHPKSAKRQAAEALLAARFGAAAGLVRGAAAGQAPALHHQSTPCTTSASPPVRESAAASSGAHARDASCSRQCHHHGSTPAPQAHSTHHASSKAAHKGSSKRPADTRQHMAPGGAERPAKRQCIAAPAAAAVLPPPGMHGLATAASGKGKGGGKPVGGAGAGAPPAGSAASVVQLAEGLPGNSPTASAPPAQPLTQPAPVSAPASWVHVAACPPSCPTAAQEGGGWCGFEVALPGDVNWQAVFEEPALLLQRVSLARGYEKVALPGGMAAYVVSAERHAANAIGRLRASMKDPVIAIDMEWRPETRAGMSNPAAVLQLASASVCVVLHVSAMGYRLPQPARELLAEPGVALLGFSWDGADERKCSETFGFGRGLFKNFVDLQDVAHQLGYHGFGLARLVAQVLGTPMLKAKSVSRSNWAAPLLTPHQIKYAALDVLAAGQLFRALRLWHRAPRSPCAACQQPMGGLLQQDPSLGLGPGGSLQCVCGCCSADLAAHASHCAQRGHAPRYGACDACGRIMRLGAKGAGGRPQA